jgi:hypothetical protein
MSFHRDIRESPLGCEWAESSNWAKRFIIGIAPEIAPLKKGRFQGGTESRAKYTLLTAALPQSSSRRRPPCSPEGKAALPVKRSPPSEGLLDLGLLKPHDDFVADDHGGSGPPSGSPPALPGSGIFDHIFSMKGPLLQRNSSLPCRRVRKG